MAVEALGVCGERAVPVLVQALGHADRTVRRMASAALTQLSPRPEDVPALAAALKDEDAGVRANAAQCLGRLGRAAGPAAGALMGLLQDADANVRLSAARALGTLGEPARATVTALRALRRDRQEDVRRAAAQAVAALDKGR
jgi:HEAT repeat protein